MVLNGDNMDSDTDYPSFHAKKPRNRLGVWITTRKFRLGATWLNWFIIVQDFTSLRRTAIDWPKGLRVWINDRVTRPRGYALMGTPHAPSYLSSIRTSLS